MEQEKKKSHSIDDLNRIYKDGEQCDNEVFADQRSNILLSSGYHYNNRHTKFWNRIRDSRELANEQKLRLTKNHIHKISKSYINNIMSQSPGVCPVPNNPKELKDQKAAELNKAVWQYAKNKNNLNMQVQSWCKDFIDIGEVATKIFWDPMAGHLVGYEQAVDEMGQPQVDESGQPASSGNPVFSGDLVFEKVYGFNLIRPAEAKSMHDAKWLCIRKMSDIAEVKALVGDDKEKLEKIKASKDETFFVFDGSKSQYSKEDKQVLLREYYFRPCYDYPNGYFYITAQNVILFEGELPYGIYPLVYEGFDEIPTTPRHRSIIKQLRPYQAEINRASSKMAEMQVTLGDDKVILQNGSKMTTGPHLPGVRALFVTGQAPTILEGRTGEQYLAYVQAQIAEMYQVANLDEDAAQKDQGADPWAQLYKSIRDKKKFVIYSDKFENYLVNVCKIYLDLARHYFDDNTLIPALGRSEYINIPEFKSQEELCYKIQVEPLSDDIETMMGRQLNYNHILQFVGNQLSKDDIGKIIRQMPFCNGEEMWSDMTVDYDNATNIILALDRGEQVQPQRSDNGEYILKRLGSRQKQADYRYLSPQTQSAYDQLIQYYEQQETQKAQDLKAAEAQFIPSSGAMIKCDYYVVDPTNKSRTVRATIPAEAIDWLIKQLDAQGSSQSMLQTQPGFVQQDLARMLQQQNGQAQPGMASGMPNNVMAMPSRGGLS